MSLVVGSVLFQDYISFSIFVSLLDKGRSMLKKDDLIGNIIGVVAFGIVLTLPLLLGAIVLIGMKYEL